MSDSATIGRVVSVDTRDIRVGLDIGSTGFTKVGADGLVTVGVVNSYVTVPAGAHRVVAIVTGVSIRRPGADADDASAFLKNVNDGQYELAATVVGRFEGSIFRSGLTGYPPLNAPVYVATPEEVEAIFIPPDVRGVRIGTSAAATGQDVKLDGNLLLGHHCAVVGSTGSGKSCTVTAILDSLIEQGIPGGHFIIFDINGEYAQSFAATTARGRQTRTLVLGPEPGVDSGLFLPHWFMNNEEHVGLFRAQEGVQAPVLQRSIADARTASSSQNEDALALQNLLTTVDLLVVQASEKWGSVSARDLLAQLSTWVAGRALASTGDEIGSVWEKIAVRLSKVSPIAAEKYAAVSVAARQQILTLEPDLRGLVGEGLDALRLGSDTAAPDFDAPVYYSLKALCDAFLPARIRKEQASDNKIAGYVATLQMRLSRLLADGRYDFITRVEQHDDPVGSYLRMLLGEDPTVEGTRSWPAAEHWNGENLLAGDGPSVTIFDLSLVASDVLATVTSLLGRLIFDFAVRMKPRAAHPILLVLEEAHRFVPAKVDGPAARSAAVFERIAKEGRKFGVSLLLASQRPSELSETVVAQCGTVIAHRLTHEADQALLRHATALSSRALLDQLPGLAQQHALVTGVSTGVPVAVRIRDVVDRPKSKDPDFLAAWSAPESDQLASRIDAIAAEWQGVAGPGGV